jgi:hypothetical protein
MRSRRANGLYAFLIAGRRSGIIAQIGRLRQPVSGLPIDACRPLSPPAVVTAITAKAAKRAISRHNTDAAA